MIVNGIAGAATGKVNFFAECVAKEKEEEEDSATTTNNGEKSFLRNDQQCLSGQHAFSIAHLCRCSIWPAHE